MAYYILLYRYTMNYPANDKVERMKRMSLLWKWWIYR